MGRLIRRPPRVFVLLAIVGVTLSLSGVAAAEDPELARAHFERGRELEEAGDLANALDEYERAYELRPSFRLHRHLGRVSRGLGRYRQAIEHFEAFLEQGGEHLNPEQRLWTEEALEQVHQLVATLTVRTPDGANVLIDGVPIDEAELSAPIVLDPGHHTLEVRLAEYQDFLQELELSSAEARTVVVQLERVAPPSQQIADDHPPPAEPDPPPVEPDPTPRRRLSRAAFWATLGVSLATVATGAVFAGLTSREFDRFEQVNRSDRTEDEDVILDEARDRGEAFALVADIGLFAGGALAVAALVMAFFTDFRREPEVDQTEGALAIGRAIARAGEVR